MIDLHTFPTPNGWKASIALEELGLPYRIVHRIYRVLDERLAGREFVADELSMADIICWPWVHLREHHGVDLAEFPDLARWYEALAKRPGFERGIAAGADLVSGGNLIDEEAKKNLFGQR